MSKSADFDREGIHAGNPMRRHYHSRSFQERREFPPMMPNLAWTGNSAGQMPWVLKRSYTDNGRLVIHEVKVKHRQFFRANRADGRLTLHLMKMDEPIPSPMSASDGEEEDAEDAQVLEKEDHDNKDHDHEKKGKKAYLFPPLSSSSSSSLLSPPFLKREKLKHLAPLKFGRRNREEKDKNAKESFIEVKRLQNGVSKLPTSSSSSSLLSLASSKEKNNNAMKSLLNQESYKNTHPDVSRTSSLPSISSSLSELLLGKGGNGSGGCFTANKTTSPTSPLQMQMPAIGHVHS